MYDTRHQGSTAPIPGGSRVPVKQNHVFGRYRNTAVGTLSVECISSFGDVVRWGAPIAFNFFENVVYTSAVRLWRITSYT